MSVEIEPMDRLADLVKELLEEGERASKIRETVEDAIVQWRRDRNN